MVALIQDKLEQVHQLCQKYSVMRLELFGSAADGTFIPDKSDLDFLVEFERSPKINAFRQYFDFLFELEELFGRHVDLVHVKAMKNRYFIESVNESRTLIYAAR